LFILAFAQDIQRERIYSIINFTGYLQVSFIIESYFNERRTAINHVLDEHRFSILRDSVTAEGSAKIENMMNYSYKRILAPYFSKGKLAMITKKDYNNIAKIISKYYLFK
jgi:hypothetical protein